MMSLKIIVDIFVFTLIEVASLKEEDTALALLDILYFVMQGAI